MGSADPGGYSTTQLIKYSDIKSLKSTAILHLTGIFSTYCTTRAERDYTGIGMDGTMTIQISGSNPNNFQLYNRTIKGLFTYFFDGDRKSTSFQSGSSSSGTVYEDIQNVNMFRITDYGNSNLTDRYDFSLVIDK